MPNLNRMQETLLDMFTWFHGFCAEHGLRYYMLGGTMLGAARHQGFIPWDDDIDVGMPRDDYRKLEAAMVDYPHPRYVLETPNNGGPEFFYPCSKLYDTHTTLVENTRYQIKRGIYLDIFPLDGAGDTREDSLAYYKPICRELDLLLAMTTGIRAGRSWYKNAAVRVMQMFPQAILQPKKRLLKIQEMCCQRGFDDCAWVGNFSGAWREKELVPREVFGKPIEYQFETGSFFGVRDYDKYLTFLYGNWRQLPPPEKRVSHHDFILFDLETPYQS